jgi:hypothetical protein
MEGVRLKDVLAKVGRKDALEISFDGADGVCFRPRRISEVDSGWKQWTRTRCRLRDERRAVAALKRLPGAHRRSRLTGPTG